MEQMTESCLQQMDDLLLTIHTHRDLTRLRENFLRKIQGLIPHRRSFLISASPDRADCSFLIRSP